MRLCSSPSGPRLSVSTVAAPVDLSWAVYFSIARHAENSTISSFLSIHVTCIRLVFNVSILCLMYPGPPGRGVTVVRFL